MKEDQSENPWLVWDQKNYPGCWTCDAADRVSRIKVSQDIAWLKRVLAWRDNQITVRLAAERRLRVLSRKAVAA